MPMRCPSQIGAPRMRFYTGFLCLSSIQVQHDLTNGYLTHTSTAVLQSNPNSVASSSIRIFSCCRRPWSGTCCSSLSVMPEKGRVSQRYWRGWDAGMVWVVQGCPCFFRLGAVLLLLQTSRGPLVLLTEPWLCSIQCKLDVS